MSKLIITKRNLTARLYEARAFAYYNLLQDRIVKSVGDVKDR